MQYILYWVLGIYALPLFGVVISMVWSNVFSSEKEVMYVVSAISETNLSYLRNTFGSIIVPLVTAYSVPIRSTEQNISSMTKWVFTFLIILFVISSISYGIVVSNEEKLKHFGEAIFNSYRDITNVHMKEALVYIAMTIGITVKR